MCVCVSLDRSCYINSYLVWAVSLLTALDIHTLLPTLPVVPKPSASMETRPEFHPFLGKYVKVGWVPMEARTCTGIVDSEQSNVGNSV